MNQKAEKVAVTVEEVKDATAVSSAGGPSVVIETESVVDGERRETAIEVRDADAPAVAVALLNADVDAPADPADGADLPVALQCLAAGVMPAATSGQVRLHLQFESGQVLPVEMSHAAAEALSRALVQHVRGG